MPVLSDVYFYYTAIKTPKKKYESEEEEFQVVTVSDKKTAKAWNTSYPAFKFKVLDKEDFEVKFKTPPPFDEGDQVFVRTFSTNAQVNGVPVSGKLRPRVFVRGSKENTVKDVTETNLVGNGSFGDLEFAEYEYTSAGSKKKSCKLKNILVKNLIEYAENSAFGEVENEEEEESEFVKPQQEAKKPVSKKTKEVVVEDEDDFEDDIPF